LFVCIGLFRLVNQVPVAVHALFFVAFSRIKHSPVCQHGASFIGDVKNIAVAFLALVVGERGIGFFFLQRMVVTVRALCQMNVDVIDAVSGFGIKKVEGVVRGREVAIHAIGHEAVGVVDVGAGFPGIVGVLDLMAGCAELRRRSPDHCIIPDTEEGKGKEDADTNKDGCNQVLFHGTSHQITFRMSYEFAFSMAAENSSQAFLRCRYTAEGTKPTRLATAATLSPLRPAWLITLSAAGAIWSCRICVLNRFFTIVGE